MNKITTFCSNMNLLSTYICIYSAAICVGECASKWFFVCVCVSVLHVYVNLNEWINIFMWIHKAKSQDMESDNLNENEQYVVLSTGKIIWIVCITTKLCLKAMT